MLSFLTVFFLDMPEDIPVGSAMLSVKMPELNQRFTFMNSVNSYHLQPYPGHTDDRACPG